MAVNGGKRENYHQQRQDIMVLEAFLPMAKSPNSTCSRACQKEVMCLGILKSSVEFILFSHSHAMHISFHKMLTNEWMEPWSCLWVMLIGWNLKICQTEISRVNSKQVLNKVKDVALPCVIEVVSSVEFQLRISKCNNKFPTCLKKNC